MNVQKSPILVTLTVVKHYDREIILSGILTYRENVAYSSYTWKRIRTRIIIFAKQNMLNPK